VILRNRLAKLQRILSCLPTIWTRHARYRRVPDFRSLELNRFSRQLISANMSGAEHLTGPGRHELSSAVTLETMPDFTRHSKIVAASCSALASSRRTRGQWGITLTQEHDYQLRHPHEKGLPEHVCLRLVGELRLHLS
jgi:hypothetical protein